MPELENKQFLDLEGLTTYHQNMSQEISEVEGKIQSISVDEPNETLVIN